MRIRIVARYFFYYLVVAYSFTLLLMATQHIIIINIFFKLKISDENFLLYCIKGISSLYDVALIFTVIFFYAAYINRAILPTLQNHISSQSDESMLAWISILYHRDNMTTLNGTGTLLYYFFGYFLASYFILSPGLSISAIGTDEGSPFGSIFLVFGIPLLALVGVYPAINAPLIGVMLRIQTRVLNQKTNLKR